VNGKLAVAIALILTAAACVSAPARREPDLGVPVPEKWDSDPDLEAGSIEQDWWTTFDDPGLDTIVQEALEHNYNIQIAAANVDAAAALARISGADLYPALGLEARGNRQKQNFIGFPIPGDGVPSATFTSYGVSVVTTWEIDLWGRIRSGAEAAVADLQGAQALLAAVQLSVAGQVAKAWFTVGEARKQVALSENTVEAFRTTAERVRVRWERGVRPSLDYRLALANQAGAEAELEIRRDRLQIATRQLELFLGRYPGDAIAGSHDLPPPPEQVPAGLPATLVSRRPDLVVAERLLAAADSRVAEAKAALYPRLALTASGGTSTQELSDLVDGDFSVWSLAANLLQPIFQGGRLRANVDLTKANAEAATALYVQNVLLAFGEVESILASEAILTREERALVTASEQSTAAQRLAEDRYDQGLEKFVTVLDAQRRALVAESSLLSVRRLRLENRIDLYLALGGGFDAADVETTATSETDDSKDDEESSS
jgi:NodT family efflux transporter outer membrane factor (OMF) lipoprotein